MDWAIRNEVTYDFDGRVSVAEAAKSILAQDRLVREALVAVQHIFPDLELQKIEVAVRQVSHASPFRSTLIAFAAGVYSEKIGEQMPDVLNTISDGRIDVPEKFEALVSLIVVVIIICILDRVRARYFPDASEQLLALEKQRLIEATANGAHVSQTAIRESVDRSLEKRPGVLTRASMDLLRPAKRHHARSLKIGQQQLDSPIIEAVPSEAEMAMHEPTTQVDELEKVTVKFRAHDLDKDKNWAATIEEVSPERLPLHVAPHIQKQGLFQRSEVKADVFVTYEKDDEGVYKPTLYLLTKVYDANAS